jgi:hypothetical protein
LKTLLAANPDLSEKDFQAFFHPRTHLRAFTGLYNPNLARANRLAWEYPIFGDFRCDFAIGDSVRKAYTFVEYEDAGPTSLFVKQGEKATRTWSRRVDAGYGQIIDWFYKLHSMTDTPEMETRLGKRSVQCTGLLIIGLLFDGAHTQGISTSDTLNAPWRRERDLAGGDGASALSLTQVKRENPRDSRGFLVRGLARIRTGE